MVGDARADREQFGTLDAEGDALPQRIDLAQHRGGRRRVGGDPAEQAIELVEARRRQLVKEGDMRREMIAFGREMRGAQRVEKTPVRRAHRRGRDDGRGARGPVGGWEEERVGKEWFSTGRY